MTTLLTDLLRVVELVSEVDDDDVTEAGFARFFSAKEQAFYFLREHGRTLLEAMRDAERVAALERDVAAKQARIDALMLEYCPDEMTPEQVAEWVRHQRPVSEQEADAARQLPHPNEPSGLTAETGDVRIPENGDERG